MTADELRKLAELRDLQARCAKLMKQRDLVEVSVGFDIGSRGMFRLVYMCADIRGRNLGRMLDEAIEGVRSNLDYWVERHAEMRQARAAMARRRKRAA